MPSCCIHDGRTVPYHHAKFSLHALMPHSMIIANLFTESTSRPNQHGSKVIVNSLKAPGIHGDFQPRQSDEHLGVPMYSGAPAAAEQYEA